MINPTSISTKNVFHQMQGSFRSIFGLISSSFYVFATTPRFLSSFQLLVNNELFHQSSFYLKNIVSSVQLLFKKNYLHFSPGEKSGGNVLDPQKRAIQSLYLRLVPIFYVSMPEQTDTK